MNTNNNFEQQISAIDTQLASKYPLNKRIWEALKLIHPITSKNCMDIAFDMVTRQDVSNVFQVLDWYKEKYPNQKNIINSLGYKPFLLNGRVYHILINLDWERDPERMNCKLKEWIDDMTQSEKDSLNEENLKMILTEHSKGKIFYSAIHELEMKIEDGKINTEISDLLAAGMFDINISLSAFRSPFFLDAQPVMFHTQQAVEKFLKSLYAHHKLAEIHTSGKTVDEFVRKYQHHIDKLSQDLKTLIPDFNTIDVKVQKLHTEVPDMNIRYKDSGKTIENAIHCIDLMIEICGEVAEKFS